jgi:uncharacterized protein
LPNVVSDTSPLQYLHQLGLLSVLAELVGAMHVPAAVVTELTAGRNRGFDVPDLGKLPWVTIRKPIRLLSSAERKNLGDGESEVLAVALDLKDPLVLLDDVFARQTARNFGIRFEGTLGLLLDAKQAGLLQAVTPFLNRLQELGFYLDSRTRAHVLVLARESSS